jgi:hypothetical protein
LESDSRGVRRYLAVYEKQFRDDETNKRMKDKAAEICHQKTDAPGLADPL